ncbi:HNH endonuclease [Methylobacterium sp. NPDC080182]|uniref:HNH endonuclease n=1 Tax=Methylobacterium sp. NPDC080182 TaxID=3390590 RepID=UPI003D006714
MARREFKPAVKREAIKRANFVCEGILPNGLRCTVEVGQGKPVEYDHVIPDWMGGDPTLENCAALCKLCHKFKTALDAADRSEARGRFDSHNNIHAPRRRMVGRGLPKGQPRKPATTPLNKTCNPPFNR